MVSRLYVGFKPVELELPEGVAVDKQHPLVHQPRSHLRREALVSEKRALEDIANQVVQIDNPNYVASVAADDQKTVIRVRRDAPQVTAKCLGGLRR